MLMSKKEFFKLVPAAQFFKHYAPDVKRPYHKMRGIDGNNKPIKFSDDDIEKMQSGLKTLLSDLKKTSFKN